MSDIYNYKKELIHFSSWFHKFQPIANWLQGRNIVVEGQLFFLFCKLFFSLCWLLLLLFRSHLTHVFRISSGLYNPIVYLTITLCFSNALFFNTITLCFSPQPLYSTWLELSDKISLQEVFFIWINSSSSSQVKISGSFSIILQVFSTYTIC